MTCGRCGQTVKSVVLHEGELWCWPCHHDAQDYGAPGIAIARDEIPGGQTFENYGPHPVTFYSHSERRAYMAKHGLVLREKFCPTPGTDKDPAGIPNPKGYADPYTLAAAAELICRNGQKSAEWDGEEAGVVRLTSGVMSTEEAIRVQNSAR